MIHYDVSSGDGGPTSRAAPERAGPAPVLAAPPTASAPVRAAGAVDSLRNPSAARRNVQLCAEVTMMVVMLP